MIEGIKRNFFPGDNWVYFKVYLGYKTSDEIIVNEISFLVKKLFQEDIISSWFFLRYNDPTYHLRIRFYVKSRESIGYISKIFHDTLNFHFEEELIWEVQLDTYKREIERYGASTMDASEGIFSADSTMVLGLLNFAYQQDDPHNIKWLLAIKATDSFLSDFGLSLKDKVLFLKGMRKGFKSYYSSLLHNENKTLYKKYQHNKTIIDNVIRRDIYGTIELGEVSSIIKQRSHEIVDFVDQIIKTKNSNLLDVEFNNFLSSHSHMSLNRIFRTRNTLNEYVIYDLLFRYLSELLNKPKHKQ